TPDWPALSLHDALPISHWSSVHGLPSSLQAVPLACFASAGHAALEPVQLSARSHAPAATRHTVLAGWKASAGQAALVPSQVSGTSQTPAAARHTVPAAAFASAGQAAALPLQNSAGSHAPAE